jgi:predicted nucleic acid-binding protein
LKPEKRIRPLVRRADDALPFVDQQQNAGPPLLLDTTVYVDVLQGRAPASLDALLRVRQINHSSVALSELTHLFGRLDPANPQTKSILAQIKGTIDDIPQHRLSAPSVQAMASAGVVAGVIARLRGLTKADHQFFLNDACMVFHAIESGSILVSRNIVDMDFINQIVPGGRVLLYRQS